MELHGGAVVAASDGPGRGVSFSVRLPRGEPPRVAAGPPPVPDAGGARRVLVVEDNADAREVLVDLGLPDLDGLRRAMAGAPPRAGGAGARPGGEPGSSASAG